MNKFLSPDKLVNTFSRDTLDTMLEYAESGIQQLISRYISNLT
jgi:hypothetical protein